MNRAHRLVSTAKGIIVLLVSAVSVSAQRVDRTPSGQTRGDPVASPGHVPTDEDPLGPDYYPPVWGFPQGGGDPVVFIEDYAAFQEYRPPYQGGSSHFHGGSDLAGGWWSGYDWYLYVCSYYYKVSYVDRNNPDDGQVTAWHGHMEWDANQTPPKYVFVPQPQDSGSWYFHLKSIRPELYDGYEGDNDDPIASGHYSSLHDGHCHLEMVKVAGLHAYQRRTRHNPLLHEFMRNEAQDAWAPGLESMFVDVSGVQGDATVQCWEFLNSTFVQYYSNIGNSFRGLKIRQRSILESPYDWNDPHILVSGNRKVRLVVKSLDTIEMITRLGYYSKCAPYRFYLCVDTGAPTMHREPTQYWFAVKFDSIKKASSSETEQLWYGAVYHTQSPLVTSLDPTHYYFRLYPYYWNGNIPCCVLTPSNVIQSEALSEGAHRVRVVAYDANSNERDADVWMYIIVPGTQ
jgi:hypothetical protein